MEVREELKASGITLFSSLSFPLPSFLSSFSFLLLYSSPPCSPFLSFFFLILSYPLSGKTPTEPTKSETGQKGEAEEAKSSEEEGSGEGEEGEEEERIEGLEPNVNHLYDPVFTQEDKKPQGGGKKKHKGGSKSRSKRGVFRDADGHSTLEKTNEKKGSVTVIGEGTVFNEKALPPQAKFVVYPFYSFY